MSRADSEPMQNGRAQRIAAVGAVAAAATFLLLTWLERRRPLRTRVEPPTPHLARNGAVAALAAATVHFAERPLVEPLAVRVEARGLGLLPRLGLPRPVETAAALLLLDYTLYVWHVLAHRVPFLWRFHAVHHVDRDLDASTAVRFHFGELLLSIPWRAAQVLVIGVRPADLRLWQNAVLVSILFHHSNLRLPDTLEHVLSRLVMTPRLHGLHHAQRAETRDANWSSGLTLWDWLHGTLRRDAAQPTIGLEGFTRPERLTLGRILAQPFRTVPPDPAAVTQASPRPSGRG